MASLHIATHTQLAGGLVGAIAVLCCSRAHCFCCWSGRFVSLFCFVLHVFGRFRLLVAFFLTSVGLATHSHSHPTCWGVSWCYCSALLLSRALFLLLVRSMCDSVRLSVLCYLVVSRVLVVVFVAPVGLATHSHSHPTCWGGYLVLLRCFSALARTVFVVSQVDVCLC